MVASVVVASVVVASVVVASVVVASVVVASVVVTSVATSPKPSWSCLSCCSFIKTGLDGVFPARISVARSLVSSKNLSGERTLAT